MSWITTADPLALLAIQAGQVNAPSRGGSASGRSSLDNEQRFIAIGESVPIVFARFRNSKGGIMVSPGATEARYENDANNNCTVYYMLPISEGQIDSIQVRDVFQGVSRVGAHTQTYNRRAGTWQPGNVLTQVVLAPYQFSLQWSSDPNPIWHNATLVRGVYRYILGGRERAVGSGSGDIKQTRYTLGLNFPLPVAPYFCGTIGSYPDISTVSFTNTTNNGSDLYARQINIFIRGGMYVTRLYDSVTGPSDNFADLVKWLLVNTSRVPNAMIDNAALLSAATFLEYNGFTCNLELREPTNYADLVSKWAPYFLLGESNASGKKGLRPLLPTTAAGQIKTTAIVPEYVFTDDLVVSGSVEIDYISLADRLPFVVQVIWRQQLESDIGIIRTAEVRYAGTADTGPYESHDLSAFCTSEDHAVKVGAYILAKRVYPTHVIRFSARPQAHNVNITVGDIIAVRLTRESTNYAAAAHYNFYQVERISKTLAGDVTYEATHFPVDSQGRSLVALDVAAATGTGIILPNDRSGVDLDDNSSSDTTVPGESYIEVPLEAPIELPLQISGADIPLHDGSGNTSDGLDSGDVSLPFQVYPEGTPPAEGSVLIAPDPCPGGSVSSAVYFGTNDDGFIQMVDGIRDDGKIIVGSLDVKAIYPDGNYQIRKVYYCGDGSSVVYNADIGPGNIAGFGYTIIYQMVLTREFAPYQETRLSRDQGQLLNCTPIYGPGSVLGCDWYYRVHTTNALNSTGSDVKKAQPSKLYAIPVGQESTDPNGWTAFIDYNITGS